MTDILPGSALATAGIETPDGVDVTVGPPRATLAASVSAPAGVLGPRILPGASAATASVQGALGLLTIGPGAATATASSLVGAADITIGPGVAVLASSVQEPSIPTSTSNPGTRTLLGVGI